MRPISSLTRSTFSMAITRLITVVVATLLASFVACVANDSGPVSVVRMREGETIAGECRFAEDLSRYPVSFRTNERNCWQAVTIGPLALAELEQMKQDVPLFWENSLPYRQALVGERIDDRCNFSSPAVQAYLEFSQTASTDWENCIMIVDVGPATERQIEKVQSLGNTGSSTAVPSSPVPPPGQ